MFHLDSTLIFLAFMMAAWSLLFLRRAGARFGLKLMLVIGSALIPLIAGLFAAAQGWNGIKGEPLTFAGAVAYYANASLWLQQLYWLPTVGVAIAIVNVEDTGVMVAGVSFLFLCGIGFSIAIADTAIMPGNLVFIAICLALWPLVLNRETKRNCRDEERRIQARHRKRMGDKKDQREAGLEEADGMSVR
jgi:hypothetical protein